MYEDKIHAIRYEVISIMLMCDMIKQQYYAVLKDISTKLRKILKFNC